MNESISEIQRLLREFAEHLRMGTLADARMAVAKLERIAALASTLTLTVKTHDGSARGSGIMVHLELRVQASAVVVVVTAPISSVSRRCRKCWRG